MRLLFAACAVVALGGCGALSGTVDDNGRVFREAQDAPISANLEPPAAEASIELLNDRIPGRGAGSRNVSEDSACEAERWQQLIGMTSTDVEGQRLPASVRVIEWGGMVTQDYRPDRLNVHLDQNGRVYRVICG